MFFTYLWNASYIRILTLISQTPYGMKSVRTIRGIEPENLTWHRYCIYCIIYYYYYLINLNIFLFSFSENVTSVAFDSKRQKNLNETEYFTAQEKSSLLFGGSLRYRFKILCKIGPARFVGVGFVCSIITIETFHAKTKSKHITLNDC